MYTRIDVVSAAEKAATTTIQKDRDRFYPFFEAAERLASRESLIVCGQSAIKMLTASDVLQDVLQDVPQDVPLQYDFYSTRGFMMARDLANVIYDADPEGLGHYTTLVTSIPHQHWKISVDGRPLFTVTAIPTLVKNACSVDSMPALIDPSNMLQVIRPELALIDIYRDLSNPALMEDFKSLWASQETLRIEFLNKLPDPNMPSAEFLARPVAEFRNKLLKNFITGYGRVIVGTSALLPDNKTSRLQIVTSNSFDNETEEVVNIAKKLGLNIGAHVVDINYPGDTRLKKLMISVIGEGRSITVLEVFNLAQYELVPFKSEKLSSIKVATAFVLMRLLLVELWASRLLKTPIPNFTNRVIHLLHTAATRLDCEANLDQILSMDFIGTAEDAEISFKREIQIALSVATDGKSKTYSQYMPAAAKSKQTEHLSASYRGLSEIRFAEQKIPITFEPLSWEV